MSVFLGIDTSNYTTSAALADENGILQSEKKLLCVESGQRGLRQSDALFLHTKQLPEIIGRLGKQNLAAIGYSARPRDREDSYMPCFLAGKCAAESLGSVLGVPVYAFSHQAGHVAAALYSCGHEELHGREFLAFHVSGGTTDVLHVLPNGQIDCVGGTDDLNAGQLIDRIGVLLGLSFPCGPALEELSLGVPLPRVKPCVREMRCHLSGFENQAMDLQRKGVSPQEIAAFALSAVGETMDCLAQQSIQRFGKLPMVFAGGVMSNRRIRANLEEKYGAYFAEPAFSSDNAAGTALLCRNRHTGKGIA